MVKHLSHNSRDLRSLKPAKFHVGMRGGPSIILASEGRNTGSPEQDASLKTNHNNKLIFDLETQSHWTTGKVIQVDFHIKPLHMYMCMHTYTHTHNHTHTDTHMCTCTYTCKHKYKNTCTLHTYTWKWKNIPHH